MPVTPAGRHGRTRAVGPRQRRASYAALGAVAGFACLLCSAAPAAARDPAPSIASDRPGLGDSAWILAPGVWQIEAGGTLNDAGTTRDGEGSILLRRGLDQVELRVYLPSPSSTEQRDDSWSDVQWGDLGVGIKLPLGGTAAWDWSVVTAVTAPTGSSGVTADAVTGDARLVGETKLSDRIGFSLNAGASASADSSDAASMVFRPTFAASVSDRVSVFAGYAGFFGRGDDRHWVETGITTAAGRNFQWDVNSAYDMQSDDWFFGIGFSRRWLP